MRGEGTTAESAWAPLSHPVFRALWIASVVSNIGTWMQNVGAAWLMTELAPSALLVALVQTATNLPVFLLAVSPGSRGALFVPPPQPLGMERPRRPAPPGLCGERI